MEQRCDVLVIGGGQAGLALGHYLAATGADFVIVDAEGRTGDVWRSRWHSLTLFTPARFSSLPGMPFPGDPERMPRKDEVADYLEQYAQAQRLPIHHRTRVTRVGAMKEGGFEVETTQKRYRARRVVIATGPFQKPAVPAIARQLGPEVTQLHSSEYRSPEQLPGGDILVVGGGNSGVQIAAELAATRQVWLSVGSRLPRLPERLLGQSIFWWLERLGLMDVTIDSRLGKAASRRDSLLGQSPAQLARTTDLRLLGRATSASGRRVATADGTEVEVAGVVWATGFQGDFGYLDNAALDAQGRPRHRRGVSPVPGLYFLGLPWQHTRGSALLGWVGRDAAYIAGQLERGRERQPARRALVS